MGAKGQVVIPKAIRDHLGFRPGDEVMFEADGRDVRVRRCVDAGDARRVRIQALRGILSDGAGTEDLMQARREERAHEERKARGRGVGRPR